MTWVQRHTNLPILVEHALTLICHRPDATAMGITAPAVVIAANVLKTLYQRKAHLKPQTASATKAITTLPQILRALPVLQIQFQPTIMQEASGGATVQRASMRWDCHRSRAQGPRLCTLLETSSYEIMIIRIWMVDLEHSMDLPQPAARSLQPPGFSNVIAPPICAFR